jgi:hypothetical protein
LRSKKAPLVVERMVQGRRGVEVALADAGNGSAAVRER